MAKTRQVTFLIGANAKNFKKGLDSAQKRMQRFGRKMKRTGRSLTQSITLPLVAAGGAAVKMASDFESSMTRIETLVGLSRTQVQGMRSDVLALSRETARAPHELSEALFTVTSAGIRGAESMEVLERAAKASAIGLGETREIARATTAIIQAYGKENINAAQATDTLTAIVREGNLEASELAPVLGRVVGIASQLGISFSEVGASIATFTRLGVSAEEAVTGLRGTMNALLKPTAEGRKALEEVGLSFEEVRRQAREEGLMSTLRGLIDAFDGNVEGLSKVIPRVRALAAVMGTAGAQGEEYEQILNSIQETTGIVDKGFERVSQTTQFKFNKALTALKTTAIELGTQLMPIANQVLDFARRGFEWFGSLSTSTKRWGLAIAGVVAAIGPLLTVGGTLVTVLASLMSPITLVVAGVAALILVGKNLADNWDVIAAELENVWDGIKLVAWKTVRAIVSAFSWMASNILSVLSSMASVAAPSLLGPLELAQSQITAANDAIAESVEEAQKNFDESSDAAKEARKGIVSYTESFYDLTSSIGAAIQRLFAFQQAAANRGGGGQQQEQETPSPKRQDVGGFMFFPGGAMDGFNRELKKVKGNTDATKAALGEMTQQARIMGDAFQSTVTNAIVSFGETLGNVFAGKTGAEGFFQKLLLVVVDFANKFGKLLVASGVAAQAFKNLIADPVTAIIAGGALIALTSAVRGLLESGPTQKVNDALITSSGDVVEFHPDDNILAMKDFSGLAMAGGSSRAVINNYLQMDGRTIFLGSKEHQIQANR